MPDLTAASLHAASASLQAHKVVPDQMVYNAPMVAGALKKSAPWLTDDQAMSFSLRVAERANRYPDAGIQRALLDTLSECYEVN